jgi:hypothetical protein
MSKHVPSKASRTVGADKGVCLDLEKIDKRKDSGGNSPEDGHDDGTENTGYQLWVSYEIHDALDRVAGGNDHDLLLQRVYSSCYGWKWRRRVGEFERRREETGGATSRETRVGKRVSVFSCADQHF